MKKIIASCLIAFTLVSCVSSSVFNNLESRYAQLKDNYNRQSKTIELQRDKIKYLDEKWGYVFKAMEEEIKNLQSRKKYGLNWEIEEENVVKEFKENFLYLKKDLKNGVIRGFIQIITYQVKKDQYLNFQ